MSTLARLGAFVVVLVAVFLLALGVGRATGPVGPVGPAPERHHDAGHAAGDPSGAHR
ncbi:hypothetical protein [Nocardioides litoris]|uniref:hypothetical protein n=1 Tax=Nocardioides litoris TaxID=1926648 RepID=UPI001476E474|nr:hypothetical protein [Nocardioides litoris]